MIRPITLPSFSDSTVQRLADKLREVADALRADSFVGDGQLLEGLEFTAGTPRLIEHKLGRRIRGWVEVTPADATGRVGLVPSHNSTTNLASQFRVTPTSSGTCHIRVF